METTEYELMRDVQSQHWWWLGREKLLSALLDKHLPKNCAELKIADVGSGFGANIPLLSKYGRVFALETDEACLKYLAKKYPKTERIKWSSPKKISKKFDVMLMADVLEHIQDDAGAMKWIADHLLPGGYAFITVPAHMHLWSEMDDVVHHHRRYSRGEILDLVGTNLKIELASYYNLILYPVKMLFVWVTKTIRVFKPSKPKKSYNDLPPEPINSLFKTIMYFEASFIQRMALPMGVSLVLVLKKSE